MFFWPFGGFFPFRNDRRSRRRATDVTYTYIVYNNIYIYIRETSEIVHLGIILQGVCLSMPPSRSFSGFNIVYRACVETIDKKNNRKNSHAIISRLVRPVYKIYYYDHNNCRELLFRIFLFFSPSFEPTVVYVNTDPPLRRICVNITNLPLLPPFIEIETMMDEIIPKQTRWENSKWGKYWMFCFASCFFNYWPDS